MLLILAAVAISSITNDGILSYAQNATNQYNQAVANEQDMLQQYVNYLNNQTSSLGNGSSGSGENLETITTETDYVGSYVDLDNNGTPDGVVYIDKAKTASGSWNSYSYTITNVTSGLKDYYVSARAYAGPFGTKDVLTVVPGTTGEERFYVMALKDIKPPNNYYACAWYTAAYDSGISEYSSLTGTGVGSGKTNTETMISKWNSSAYGTQNADDGYLDIWGVIQDKVAEGWYVPSKDEWAAFGVGKSNYESLYDLEAMYWTSSIKDFEAAWYAYFYGESMYGTYFRTGYNVRLGKNF